MHQLHQLPSLKLLLKAPSTATHVHVSHVAAATLLVCRALLRQAMADDGDESKVSAPVTPSCPRPEASMDWSYDARSA